MKEAEDWQVNLVCSQSHWDRLVLIRAIQADALRWAANLSGEEATEFILKEADKLDPPKAK